MDGSNACTAFAKRFGGKKSVWMEVYDLVALRVITSSVKGLLCRAWDHPPDLGARSGAVQGLHCHAPAEWVSIAPHVGGERTRVSFEVQIRTEQMHRVAEDGIAAHWKYKEGTCRRQD